MELTYEKWKRYLCGRYLRYICFQKKWGRLVTTDVGFTFNWMANTRRDYMYLVEVIILSLTWRHVYGIKNDAWVTVIHGNKCTILFLTRYFMSWTHNSAKNIHRSLISQLSPRTVVSDLTLWRHHSWSVTSHEREILALWRHICR